MTDAPVAVRTEVDGRVLIVTIDRPRVRNAVDRPTADALTAAFRTFDGDDELAVAVLTGGRAARSVRAPTSGRSPIRKRDAPTASTPRVTGRWAPPAWC